MITHRLTTVLSVALSAIVLLAGFAASADWPTWRGPNADGVAPEGHPPTKWGEDKNVKWKVKVEGTGDSTPVIWGDKIFMTTAIPQAKGSKVPFKFNLLCLDRETGDMLWERTVREEVPHEGHHPSSSLASYSPVTDGEHVWVSFGSRGLHCYDLDGNHQWSAELIKLMTRNAFGEGSSPAIAGDAIIVVADHEGDSKIFSFNKLTGEKNWEKDRDEMTSWATPLPVMVDGKLQIVTSATNLIRSYDAATGDVIWQCEGQTPNAIPSPVAGFGNVYCASGYRGASLQAIKLGHTGDLSGTDAISWEVNKDTPYVASPLLYGDKIYVTRGLGGNISCYDARTGEIIFQREKLEGIRQIYASPVGAGGYVYVTGRKGTFKVLEHGDRFKVVETNQLDDGFDGSPVVIGDELYLKGDTYLYCIAES